MSDAVKGQLRDYCDECKVDNFLHIIQLDYVGVDSCVCELLSTFTVCRKIQKLFQEVLKNEQITHLSSDVLCKQVPHTHHKFS